METNIARTVAIRISPILILGFFISYVVRVNLGVLYSPLSAVLQLSAATFGLATATCESLAPVNASFVRHTS